MEKKITVYIVKSADKEKIYPTKSRANEAVALLGEFGVTAEVVAEKRKVTLA